MHSSPTWLLVANKLAWVALVLGIAAIALNDGCVTAPIDDPIHPLALQILVPRTGFTGLTNGSLRNGVLVITEQKFEDENFRKTANANHFICRMGGKRYMICKDQPGLCRVSYTMKKKCFLGMACHDVEDAQIVEYLPASGYKLFLDSDLVCYSEDKYDIRGW